MIDRPAPTHEARIIPLRLIGQGTVQGTIQATVRSAEAAALFRTGTRTLRPFEVLLLSPILVPLTVIVLLLLLAWFVAWLATVGALFTFNLIGDLSSAVWRLNGCLLRAP
jgi:hypothetical protein